MAEIRIKDEGGEEITMIDFGEFRSSTFGRTVEEIVDINRRLPELKFKDGDVLICSYPKAGCTWMYEILTMLLRGQAEGPIPSKVVGMLEATSQESMDELVTPRLLNTHLPYRRLPKDVHQKNVKTVLVVRNPKDVAVSLYNMMQGFKHYNYKGTFNNWLPLFMRGDLAYDTYWRYYMDYEVACKSNFKENNILIVYYEDMKKNLSQEITRLCDFIDCHLDDEILAQITNACQFKAMETRYTTGKLGSGEYRAEVKHTFMRKGMVGDWKNWFTVAQNELLDSEVASNMADTSFRLIYQLT